VLTAHRYELDLLMWGAFSYGLPGAMGPTLGSLYVQHLVQTFSNASAPGITLEFGYVRDTRFAPPS
jgi:acid phosphatase